MLDNPLWSQWWHLVDSVLVKPFPVCDVRFCQTTFGADCWSDHQLASSAVSVAVWCLQNREQILIKILKAVSFNMAVAKKRKWLKSKFVIASIQIQNHRKWNVSKIHCRMPQQSTSVMSQMALGMGLMEMSGPSVHCYMYVLHKVR